MNISLDGKTADANPDDVRLSDDEWLDREASGVDEIRKVLAAVGKPELFAQMARAYTADGVQRRALRDVA